MLAMKNYLEDLGHSVVILTYQKNFDFDKSEASKNSMSFANLPYYLKNYLFEKGFGLTCFNTRKAMAHKKSWQELTYMPYDNNDCDAIIIGSDEVFSIDVGCNQMMYGYGLQHPAIAYAPAFGRSTVDLLKEYDVYDLIKSGLEKMYALSARDIHTQTMIEEMTGRKVSVVCDPVLLYDGHGFSVDVKPPNKKFLLVYSYDSHMVDNEEVHSIREFANNHNLITVSLGTYHKWCDKNIVCNAREWYSYFKYADCVVTDTFHGSVVAIKNHCNAAIFIRSRINSFKMESLLKETGLEDRLLESISADNLEKVLAKSINYKVVDSRIEKMLETSKKYLHEALENIDAK